MARFVKLTRLQDKPVWLSIDWIAAVYKNGDVTQVDVDAENYHHVKESVSDVMRLIQEAAQCPTE